ncbi:MAG TPA: right-handed parallel beta-helix repeat-containing protein [Patescibacteria group bacterium]|nr:right-handed parallel beta-helix repeat-containing protein [Patescibacteria group bacterium]
MRISSLRLTSLLLAAIVLSAGTAHAAPLRTLYVAPTGSDSADGGAITPWRTLQRAANLVRAGDLVIVRAGHYAGFNLTTSGTAANPIVFSADPGVVVDSPNPVRTQDGINLEGASYIVIEGFTVVGLPRTGIRSVTNHHVTIRRNVGDLNGRWGILTGFSDDLLIEDNEMSRSVAEHGIYVGNSGDRPVIRRNHVWGNSGNGIHMNGDLSQGGDGVISGAVVEGNVIHGNGRTGGSGINGDGVQSSRIVNNILYDNHASGISLYQIDGGQPSRNNFVAHNTIVQAADGRWAINIQDGATGNHVVNNILLTLHTFRGAIDISTDSLSGFVSDSNAVIGRFTTNGGNSVLTLAAWRQATGQDLHSFTTTPDALFVDTAAADYHLRADAPARDIAMTPTDVLTDFEGLARPSGPASDIGADEYHVVTLPPPPPPPAPADLIETAVSNPPASVRRGGHFTVTDTVKNQGGTASGPSVTSYFLSSDPVKSAADRALDNRRSVPALAAGASSTGSVSVHVPSGTPRGTYFLLACSDQTAVVVESSNSNNCRAAMTSVIVK